MTKLKLSLIVFTVFILLLLGGGFCAYKNLDATVKNFVQTGASMKLGVPVTIGDLKIDIPARTLDAANFQIANPEGFKRPAALNVANVKIKADTLSREVLIFDEIHISDIDVFFTAKTGGSNFKILRENAGIKNEPAKAEPGSNGPKIIIKDFHLRDITATTSLLLESTKTAELKVKEIHLTDIGMAEGGVSMDEALAQIQKAVKGKFQAQVTKAGIFSGLKQGALMALGVPPVFQIPGVSDAVLGGVESIGEGITDIFSPDAP